MFNRKLIRSYVPNCIIFFDANVGRRGGGKRAREREKKENLLKEFVGSTGICHRLFSNKFFSIAE